MDYREYGIASSVAGSLLAGIQALAPVCYSSASSATAAVAESNVYSGLAPEQLREVYYRRH